MAICYGIEKYGMALQMLAVSTAPWQRRLYDALTELIQVEPGEDLPPDLLRAHSDLMDRASRIDGAGGKLHATISQMAEGDARQMMKDIITFHSDLKASQPA